MAKLRVDFVFSYWIYAWYLLYAFKIISFSPKFALMLGVMDNIFMLLSMLLYGTSKKTIVFFIIINSLIKVLPLYYLKNETIKLKDIYFTIVLFCIFVLWLYINGKSFVGNFKAIYNSLLHGKNETPFMALLEKIEKNYKNI